jgi:hypothetical protein
MNVEGESETQYTAWLAQRLDEHFAWKAGALSEHYARKAARALELGLPRMVVQCSAAAVHWAGVQKRLGTDTANLRWLVEYNAAMTVPLVDPNEVTGFEVLE